MRLPPLELFPVVVALLRLLRVPDLRDLLHHTLHPHIGRFLCRLKNQIFGLPVEFLGFVAIDDARSPTPWVHNGTPPWALQLDRGRELGVFLVLKDGLQL